jgi:hypothetical protein
MGCTLMSRYSGIIGRLPMGMPIPAVLGQSIAIVYRRLYRLHLREAWVILG